MTGTNTNALVRASTVRGTSSARPRCARQHAHPTNADLGRFSRQPDIAACRDALLTGRRADLRLAGLGATWPHND